MLLRILVLLVSLSTAAHAATFTTTQDGDFEDGGTWGNTSPGSAGTDYPGTGDDFSIGHTVTIGTGDSVSSHGALTTGGELVINGTLTLTGAIAMAANTTLSGTSGTLDLDGYDIGSAGYYLRYYLDFGGSSGSEFTITGPGRLGFHATYNIYGYPSYQFDHVDVSGLTGFMSCGNVGGGSPIIITNSSFTDITGTFALWNLASKVTDDVVFTISNTDFDNVQTSSGIIDLGYADSNQTEYDVDTGAARTISDCTFTNSDHVYISNGFAVSNCIFHNTPTLEIGTKYGKVFDGILVYNDEAVDSIFSHGNFDIKNSYFYTTSSNVHLIYGEKNLGTTYDPFQVYNNVFENTATSGDGADFFILPDEQNEINIFGNIFIDSSGGTFVNAIGQDVSSDLNVYDNTIYTSSNGAYGNLIRNESGGEFVGETVSVRNNLVYNTASSTPGNSIGAYMLNTAADQLTYADYNAWYNIGDNYSGVSITGLSEGSSAGFAASDMDEVDPQFVDAGRGMADWDSSLGGPGTAANAVAELLKRNQSDWDSDYNIAALVAYVRAGYVPTNSAYDGSASDGGDIGAMDYTPPVSGSIGVIGVDAVSVIGVAQ